MKKWLKVLGMLLVVLAFSISFQGGKDAKAYVGYISMPQQTDVSESSITIKWNAYNGAVMYGYLVEGASVPIEDTTMDTQATIGNLPAGYALTVQITAYDSVGNIIAQSSKTSVKTLPGKLSKSEFGPTAANTYSNIYYFGANTATADGYQWQFATASGKVKKTASATGRTGSLSLSNFINGTYYKYRVRPYINCNGVIRYSTWSVYKTIGVLKSGGKYKATKSSLKLSWTKVSGAKKYVIYGSKSEKSGFKKIKTVKASKRSLLVKKIGGKKLKKGTRYYFRIIPVAKVSGKSVKADSYSVLYGWTRSF